MTRPGLITGLPGGTSPLMRDDDPRLLSLLKYTHEAWPELDRMLHKRKLGLAFESLMAWGMVHGLGVEVIGRDVQIFEDKRTIGALDMVVRDAQGEVTHWELAYKLYLQCDAERGWTSWLGPAGRDRLSTKLQHMLEHQLPLSTRPEAVVALSALGVDRIDHRRIMLQGTLFSPWASPAAIPKAGLMAAEGRWLREDDLPELLEAHPDWRWIPRSKPLWFGPSIEGSAMVTAAELRERLPLHNALLLSRLDGEEEQLFFVVPSSWNR